MSHTISSPFTNGQTIGHDLNVRGGRLYFRDVELAGLMTNTLPGQEQPLGSPLEVVYLPKIIDQVHKMQRWFAEAAQQVGYPAPFEYAYASKANSSEEVTRTALAAGAHYETSSAADIDIVRFSLENGLMPYNRMCINNGFKTPGTRYSRKLLELRRSGFEHVIPVFDDLDEITPFIESGMDFKVGLRQKIDGEARSLTDIEQSNIRFGMDGEQMQQAAQRIAEAPNLTLVMYHAMQDGAGYDPDGWLRGFEASMHRYAALAKQHPSLHMYNWGGGLPATFGDLQDFDYPGFIARLLQSARRVSEAEAIPAPTLVGEYGRYTTSEHGFHLFKVIKAKDNNSALPWYLIDGSIMSSFPDGWALGVAFTVLPLTNLDRPFHQVMLGGLTCDSDDVYPTRPHHEPLYMPVDTDELYVGFFGIGSYQEMLGGMGGAKHCLLPEAAELIIERGKDGNLTYEVLPEQSNEEILTILGYQKKE